MIFFFRKILKSTKKDFGSRKYLNLPMAISLVTTALRMNLVVRGISLFLVRQSINRLILDEQESNAYKKIFVKIKPVNELGSNEKCASTDELRDALERINRQGDSGKVSGIVKQWFNSCMKIIRIVEN